MSANGIAPPVDNKMSIGKKNRRWKEGHFGEVYAGNMEVSKHVHDGENGEKIDYSNLINVPVDKVSADHTHDGNETLKISYNNLMDLPDLTKLSSLPIGTVVPYDGTNPPPGFIAYGLGETESRAMYPDLWRHAQEQGRVISEAEWQAMAATQSSVGYYSDGDGENTFRMPLVVDFFRASSADRPPGTYQKDAIRDITGTFWVGGLFEAPADVPSGAFTLEHRGGKKSSGGDGVGQVNTFKASNAPGVQVANENRPKSISMLYCVKAFDAPVNAGLIDLGQIPAEIQRLGAQYEGLALKRLWVSGEYTPILNTPTIVSHGLNIDPLKAKGEVLLKCVVAQSGYSVGDYAISPMIKAGSAIDHSLVPAITPTTIQLNTGSQDSGLYVINKASGSYSGVTLANWRYVFRIWY